MTVDFKNMSDASNNVALQRKLLDKYSEKKPRMFLQFDHFGDDESSCPRTWELMDGSPLRILLNGEISDPIKLSEMLRSIADMFSAPEHQERLSTQLAMLRDPENARFELEGIRNDKVGDFPFWLWTKTAHSFYIGNLDCCCTTLLNCFEFVRDRWRLGFMSEMLRSRANHSPRAEVMISAKQAEQFPACYGNCYDWLATRVELREIDSVPPAMCLMRFLRNQRIDFGAGRGIVALLMACLLGLSMTGMNTVDLYSSLAERSSATERVGWRVMQHVGGCLGDAGTHPKGQGMGSGIAAAIRFVSMLRTKIQPLVPGRIFTAPPEHFCA